MTLSKSYEAAQIEEKWYPLWQKADIFSASPDESLPKSAPKKVSYVVMMPPPNVTGVLHNGHALFVTLQDILVRYHRMKGFNALWLPGIDHAGIATQTVVERELKKHENKTRGELGREEFIKRVWQWKEKHGARIIEQLKLMGASADWDKCRFTMDDQCSKAVREAFVRMWNDGLIYRGERLVNWDPDTLTALSDEEVDHVTRMDQLWKFAYQVKHKNAEIIIATTRPETMLGDVAVAVHPDDERYKEFIGEELNHPFFPERKVIVVADHFVDPAFGTGAVKITPAHDHADFAMASRHGLPMITILTWDGKINENGGEFQGQDRFAARKNVWEKLEQLSLTRGAQDLEHAVTVSQRSGADIEPMLSRQFFVKTKLLAQKAYEAVENGETRIIPGSWKKTWDHFLLNIQDWCISRQLWWGHQIPVFYDVIKMQEFTNSDIKTALRTLTDDQIRQFSVASTDDLAKLHPERYVQEEDVLDTWFSSGLWPFSTLGWPEKTKDLEAFYPGAVLETGFDILFFWVARMMMMGIYFMKEVPFKDIYLHAMVRDAHGRKMSKSLGNAIDPVDVINGISLVDLIDKTKTYPVPPLHLPKVLEGIRKDYPEGIPASGADGLRLSLAMLSGQGRDVKLAISRVAGYRAFLNKIWNATRFALMNVDESQVITFEDAKKDLSWIDGWILSRLQQTVSQAEKSLQNYRFDEMADGIYQFFWTEFCDWYIELLKPVFSSSNAKEKAVSSAVLIEVLDVSMRLLHPICPFISEEIWQQLPGKSKRFKDTSFCATAPYPIADIALINKNAEKNMELLKSVVVMIRNARQESNLPAQKKVAVNIVTDNEETSKILQDVAPWIQRLAWLESYTFSMRNGFTFPKAAAVNSNEHVDVVLPLEGLIDLDAERVRLQKELEKVQKELASLEGRLSNEGFLRSAKSEVVEQCREQADGLAERSARLKMSLARVSK